MGEQATDTPVTRRAALWGEHYVNYGKIGAVGVSDSAALAISRGAFQKPYWALDPNEDAVAAVVGPRSTLLICADGPNGFDSVSPAVESVLARFGDDPPQPGSVDPIPVFDDANAATIEVTSSFEDARSQSRTTLAFALIDGGRVQWAAMGDAPVYLAEPDDVRLMIRDEHYFIGSPMDAEKIGERMHGGNEQLSAGSWVVLASDGLSDYASADRGQTAVAEAIAEAPAPMELAESLIEAAFRGHAGDNVAVALARAT